ncbi:MAG TPA: hypothetical protein ENG90_12715, partial [Gammaproteobacteria bacterium]|nr:hypothetical protein [Gammaproteobacteria bacterium]
MNQGKKIIYAAVYGLGIALGGMFQTATAATLDFAIQPILGEKETKIAFQPLADYIAKISGDKVVIHTAR